jgi:hypothetical protein
MSLLTAILQSKVHRLFAAIGLGAWLMSLLTWRYSNAGQMPTLIVIGGLAYGLAHMGFCIRLGMLRDAPIDSMKMKPENEEPVSLICFFFAILTATPLVDYAF